MTSGQAMAQASSAEIAGVWVAAILTLMVFTRLIRDNPLARFAEHLFVGTAVGYAIVLAYDNVLLPKLIRPLATDPQNNLALLAPAVLAILLIARPIRPLRPLAAMPLAVVLGAGAALAVAGAVAGTLVPQAQATMLSLNPGQAPSVLINNLIIVVGVLSTVLYFFFTAKPDSKSGRALGMISVIGKWTVVVALGAVFAASVTARLALLVGRVHFLMSDWLGLIR